MTTKYLTTQGDMLDAICHRYYSGRPGATEAVLQANPRLAKLGAILPAGLVIQLPDLGPAENQSTVSLWD